MKWQVIHAVVIGSRMKAKLLSEFMQTLQLNSWRDEWFKFLQFFMRITYINVMYDVETVATFTAKWYTTIQ